MSTSSIYENKWIDLVFENRNKEYGAYQLRHESSKNSIKALFMGLLLITAAVCVTMLVSKLNHVNVSPTLPDIPVVELKLTDIPYVTEKSAAMPAVKSQPTETVIEKSQLTNPTIVEASRATPEIAKNTENTVVAPTTGETNGTLTNVLTTGGNGGTEIAKTPSIGNELVTPGSLDKLPEFPGGINKFYTYVGNNFNRPELDSERTVRIYVSFVIERDGSMTDIIVKNDPGYGLGKEAVRVLKSLRTKWSPGMVDSKPVRTAYNLPITIKAE
ncbi:energy transducer TonB [Flavobacterium sp. LS1R47]|jgi:protein TonB|uniref:Energy transducer TonB n=1 Tax=Flavobacterium frigoritolerans TaxID=2987686 RepID=A0A9X3C0P5_9FLAO|nr:energy transducer TonB [Flavobacterium frigoritolerans]MCV9931166.1 energy transducer TonB [Flavobacterium frigoritolerans]